jgi:hypothetical protein
MNDLESEKQLLIRPRKVGFRLKKQLLTKKKFFYFSDTSEAEKQLKESEFGGGLENSSIRTFKLALKPS